MSDKFIFELDGLEAISINSAYPGKNRRFLSPKAKKYKKDIINLISPTKERFRANLELRDKYIKMEMYISSFRWITKAGKIRRNDISNKIKLTEDAVFEAIGLDDSQVFELNVFKVRGDPGIKIVLSSCDTI